MEDGGVAAGFSLANKGSLTGTTILPLPSPPLPSPSHLDSGTNGICIELHLRRDVQARLLICP